MNKNGSFKKKRVYFSQVSNEALRDENLSLKAKGLYSLIQSYITIENFTLYKTTLKKQCKEGDKAFESTWSELKRTGYLEQKRSRNSDGSFYYQYDLLDSANHTPKKEGVDNGVPEKGGNIIIPDFNNTDLNNTKSFKGNEITFTFDSLLKNFSFETIDNSELALQAISFYLDSYETLHGKHIEYTRKQWIDILENILKSDVDDLDTNMNCLIESITKHLTTNYKYKEMYYLHNFKGKAKDNRLYESSILGG